MSLDLTDGQKEAFRRWKDKPESERHPSDLIPQSEDDEPQKTTITQKECDEMRRKYRNDEGNVNTLGEEYDCAGVTVGRHIFNRNCSHDGEEESCESPIDGIDTENMVDVTDCDEMRLMYHDGMEIKEITDELDRKYNQVYYHLSDRCTCQNHIEPKDTRSNS